mmetsp:Transcript_46023/g.148276  ORF Transcript_46023/g.148276 Transcript_46023/m.148276 type:complete len:230 (+) Transcript_46023:1544-2233(+)
MMTVSAVCRLMPSPPARVEQRKTESLEEGALNALMSMARCTRFVEPSRRAKSVPRALRNSSMRSSIDVQPEKRTTRWPCGSSSSSRPLSVASLPEEETRSSPHLEATSPIHEPNSCGCEQHLRSDRSSDCIAVQSLLTAPDSSRPSSVDCCIRASTFAPESSSWRESSHCVADMGTYTSASVFAGSDCSTSRLRRRSMKAESSWPHLLIAASSIWPRPRSKASSNTAES